MKTDRNLWRQELCGTITSYLTPSNVTIVYVKRLLTASTCCITWINMVTICDYYSYKCAGFMRPSVLAYALCMSLTHGLSKRIGLWVVQN